MRLWTHYSLLGRHQIRRPHSSFDGMGLLTSVYIWHDASNATDIDDLSLGPDEKRMEYAYHSHGPKDIDGEHLLNFLDVGIGSGHRIAYIFRIRGIKRAPGYSQIPLRRNSQTPSARSNRQRGERIAYAQLTRISSRSLVAFEIFSCKFKMSLSLVTFAENA